MSLSIEKSFYIDFIVNLLKLLLWTQQIEQLRNRNKWSGLNYLFFACDSLNILRFIIKNSRYHAVCHFCEQCETLTWYNFSTVLVLCGSNIWIICGDVVEINTFLQITKYSAQNTLNKYHKIVCAAKSEADLTAFPYHSAQSLTVKAKKVVSFKENGSWGFLLL